MHIDHRIARYMTEKDIRWEQRFSNYRKALGKLHQAVDHIQNTIAEEAEDNDQDEESVEIEDEMLKESLIKRFEFTHELAWNVMKDYAEFQGKFEVKGSRDATREAFQMGLIKNGELWMEMIKCRNLTSHTYDSKRVDEIYREILDRFYPAFKAFETRMEELRSMEQASLF